MDVRRSSLPHAIVVNRDPEANTATPLGHTAKKRFRGELGRYLLHLAPGMSASGQRCKGTL